MKDKMKNVLLKLSVVTLFVFNFSTMKGAVIDTLYYDKNWKGVESILDAEYVRYINTPKDPQMAKAFRDHYSTGELRAKGHYISINKYDNSKSVFDGEVETYYKSGALLSKMSYKNGVIDGLVLSLSEDGSIKTETNYVNGEPGEYFVAYKDNECYGKFYSNTLRPKIEAPQSYHIKTTTDKLLVYQTYLLNGIKLSCAEENVKEYGKYYRIHVFLTNMTSSPIEFTFNNIRVQSRKGITTKDLKPYSVDEFVKRIDKKSKFARWFYQANERTNANQAGNVNVNVKSDNTYNQYTTTNSTARVYGNNGSSALGYGTSTSNTYGNNTSNTTITIRDNAAAYQAQQIAQKNIEEYNRNYEMKKKDMAFAYFKEGYVLPYSTEGGFIHFDKGNGDTLIVNITIDGITYPFTFNLSK